MSIKEEVKMPTQQRCERCGYISSNKLCKACILLEGLNKGLPKLGIGKTPKNYRSDLETRSKCSSCTCKSSTAASSDTAAVSSDTAAASSDPAAVSSDNLSEQLQDLTVTESPVSLDKTNLDF